METINIQIERTPIEPRMRRLTAEYTVETVNHGIMFSEEMAEQMAEQITREIDIEVLAEVRLAAEKQEKIEREILSQEFFHERDFRI